MRAKTDSKSKLLSRPEAVLSARASRLAGASVPPSSTIGFAAPQRVANSSRTTNSDTSDSAAVFKKTPYIADLRPTGRDVAKDIDDAGNIPLLMKTQLEHDFSYGDRLTIPGRTFLQDVKSETRTPHQEVVRQAQRPDLGIGSVELNRNLVPEGANVKVAGMSYLQFSEPGRRCGGERLIGAMLASAANVRQRGHIPARPGITASFDVNLTDDDGLARTSEPTAGATDQMSDALWNDAQQVRCAVRGAAVGPGGATEKHCYANV